MDLPIWSLNVIILIKLKKNNFTCIKKFKLKS